jgi:hypothetical protein
MADKFDQFLDGADPSGKSGGDKTDAFLDKAQAAQTAAIQKAAQNAPPPPAAPIPAGLQGPPDPMDTTNGHATDSTNMYAASPLAYLVRAIPPKDRAKVAAKGLAGTAALAATPEGGSIPWALANAGLASYLTQNMSDAAVTGLAGGLTHIPGVSNLMNMAAKTRGANIALGAGKTAGTYGLLTRLHALINGDPQPPLNPFNSAPINPQDQTPLPPLGPDAGPLDYLQRGMHDVGQALPPIPGDVLGYGTSGLLGGALGRSQVLGVPSKFESQEAAYNKLQQEIEGHNAIITGAKKQLADQAPLESSAKTAVTEAKMALNSHQAQMARNTASAVSPEQAQFNIEQAQHDALHHVATVQVGDAQATMDKVTAGLKDFDANHKIQAAAAAQAASRQAQLDAQTAQANAAAKSASDLAEYKAGLAQTKLNLQSRLDDLSDPVRRLNIVPPPPDLAGRQAEIARINGFKANYPAGPKAAMLQPHLDAADALQAQHEQAINNEVLNTKAQIRQVTAQRLAARPAPPQVAPPVPPAPPAPLEQDPTRQLLTSYQQAAQQKLQAAQDLQSQVAAAKLAHAQTAPGASVASAADVAQHEQYRQNLAAALKNQASLADQHTALDQQMADANHNISLARVKAANNGYLAKPVQPASDYSRQILLSTFKKLAPTLGAGLIAHDASGMGALGSALVGGGTAGISALLNTDIGNKLLRTITQGQPARVLPLLTNTINDASSTQK